MADQEHPTSKNPTIYDAQPKEETPVPKTPIEFSATPQEELPPTTAEPDTGV